MKLVNDIVNDYKKYCHHKLLQEFGTYKAGKYDSMYLYQRFKCRIIEQRKRNIIEAPGFPIPAQFNSAYQNIKNDILKGENLKKYQSRKLKSLDYNDDMLSHWGIQHFHLGDSLDSDGFVLRTGELLFIFFTHENAYILGLFNHISWCDLDLIEILHENWPHELMGYKSGNDGQRLTEEQHRILRKKHANGILVTKDGTEYFSPGIGVAASGAPISAVLNTDRVVRRFEDDFGTIKANIDHILDSDPEKRTSDSLTIGMRICHQSRRFIYCIKETDFEFRLNCKS